MHGPALRLEGEDLLGPAPPLALPARLTSMKEGNAAMDMKVKNATTKKSSAARLKTAFQLSSSWK
jgi:hypothetical protein